MTKGKKLGLNVITAILGTLVFTNVQANELFGQLEPSSNDLNIINSNGQLPSYVISSEQQAQQAQQNAVNAQSQTQGYDQYSVNQPPVALANGLPTIPENIKDRARRSFDSAMTKVGGLSPDMIRAAKLNYTEKQKAIEEDVEEPVRVESRTIPISLGVSKQKEVIRTSVNMSTAISVVDSTGKPWDVVNSGTGNERLFTLSRLDGAEGSLFSINTNAKKARSNVLLVLKEAHNGIKVPIVLDLVSGQSVVDDRVVLRVQAVGPNGSVEQAKLTQGVDSKYNAWLDGMVPKTAKKLKTNNSFVKAWKERDGSIVVISKHHIYSPASSVMLSSPDGDVTLYKLSTKSSVLLARDLETQEELKISLSGF